MSPLPISRFTSSSAVTRGPFPSCLLYTSCGQALVFPEDEASAVLQPAYDNGPLAHELAAPFYARVKGQDEVTKKQYLDMNMWLPGDILLKADKMCMAHSLEPVSYTHLFFRA